MAGGRRKSYNTGGNLFPRSARPRLQTSKSEDEIVPAVVDMNTGMWALHVKVGDIIDYPNETGGTFQIRIAGFLANSILQGDLVISEKNFVKHFPSASGYRVFLIDSDNPVATAKELSFSLECFADCWLNLAGGLSSVLSAGIRQGTA